MTRTLGVGMIGYAFMGALHSQAWRTLNHVYDPGADVEMRAICGRSPEAVTSAAAKLGWATAETQWRAVVERDDIDIIDICTPGDSHEEIAVAALAAGKHVLCEKPLANSVPEAERMAAAAAGASGKSMVGFSYRRVPAVTYAQHLVSDGRLGRIFHVRALYLQDWIVDPEFPLVWRLQKEIAGSGALGDIGAHIIDMAQFITGSSITGVSGLLETFVDERPLVGEAQLLSATASHERGPVTVDDAALFQARFDNGAVGSFEATRFANGRRNGLEIEVNGSLGSLRFDFQSANELLVYDHRVDAKAAGWTRISVTQPDHPYMSAWWPPGHLIGYEHSFTHQFRDFVEAIVDDGDPRPSFADGLQVQRVLEAVETSAAAESLWTNVAT